MLYFGASPRGAERSAPLAKDAWAMVRNAISEKMLPPEVPLLAVAEFGSSRRDLADFFFHKSLKNNNLPPPPPLKNSPRALSASSRTFSHPEPDDRWNDVPRWVRYWAGRRLCGSALISRRRAGLSPRGIGLYARVRSGIILLSSSPSLFTSF